MKTNKLLLWISTGAFCLGSGFGQTVPGAPETNGITPKTVTFYVNNLEDINNGSTESLGVSIANNGNVIIGWEDDGDGVNDFEAVWTLYSPSGNALITATNMHSVALSSDVTSKFLSYFRSDGSPVPGITSWGPKIKANPFGDGMGMGATSYGLGFEVPEFSAIQGDDDGPDSDFPSVQLLNNNGEPLGIVSGLSDAEAQPAGGVRIGDWDYLSNGNIVIAGESRQNDDLSSKYGGAAPGKHAVYRIVTPAGQEVKAASLVSDVAEANELWHGLGVTKDGFAIRFPQNGLTMVRLFNNDGTPASTNIDLAAVTGKVAAGAGGRGDSSGFHGNGTDAYVYATVGTDEDGLKKPWLTVLNTNGTVRFSRSIADDIELINPGGVDAAITPDGRVLAVFDDILGAGGSFRVVFGRLFDKTGNPLGGTFYVSETETPDTVFADSESPRVAWRNELAAVIWESQNNFDGLVEVAARFFSTFKAGSIESAGLTRIVDDTPVILPSGDSLGNWEPYASVLGTNHFLIECNTFAEGTSDKQRYVVQVQPATGGTGKLNEGFFADSGTPFNAPINGSRDNGNPGRVAGDAHPGAVNYMVGGETSLHAIPEFRSDNRWDLGFEYAGTDLTQYPDVSRYGTVQTFALNPSTLGATSLMKAVDSANGRLTSGTPPSTQVTRFGGDVAGLSDGNFVSVVEDRSNVRNPSGNTIVATIFAPNGTVVKDSFVVADGDIWANVASFKGGFAVRVKGIIYFYDNAGTPTGQVDSTSSGESYDPGRGDGTRLAGHINSPFVFLTGKVAGQNLVKVSAFDSRDHSAAGTAIVSEPAFSGDFDRANLAVDALNRVAVGWVCQPAGYEKQQVATRVMAYDAGSKSFSALTPSFLPFINAAPTGNIHTYQMTLAMTTRAILVGAKGEINLENKPDQGANSPTEMNFYTVISHPAPANDPTAPLGSSGGEAELAISIASGSATISWDADGFTLQSSDRVNGGWSNVTTTGKSYNIPSTTGSRYFRLVK